MKLTDNERIVLNQLALNLYQPNNGARPMTFNETSDVWSNCLDSHNAPKSLKGRTLSATCASLAKKGLVSTFNDTKPHRRGELNESTIRLTSVGYDEWRKAYPAKPEDVLQSITWQLDGHEWSPDTLDTIANILRTNGYQVRDVKK